MGFIKKKVATNEWECFVWVYDWKFVNTAIVLCLIEWIQRIDPPPIIISARDSTVVSVGLISYYHL